MAAARDDNGHQEADEPTQILASDEGEWPVADFYRIEPDAAGVERPTSDAVVVVSHTPVHEESARRFPVDPVPGVLAAIVAAIVLIGLGAWLVARNGGDADTATAADIPTSTTAPRDTTPTSTTPRTVKRSVPDVTGMDVNEARAALEDVGLNVRVVRRASAEAVGEVLRQVPKAGAALAADEAVVLTVAKLAPSSQSVEVETPTVVGLIASNATDLLRDAGLRARIELVTSDEPSGTVLEQSPAPGTEITDGSLVTIQVAKARKPAVERVELPDIIGASLADGRARLRDLGFKVRVARVVAEEPAGTIVGQSPSAGAEVREGTTVTLRVSTGPSEVTVPDVTGLAEESARLELENAGFEVRMIDEPTDDPTQDAVVLDQTPRGGSTAGEGAVVTITIARFG